jgi:hypothetical protein
VTSRVTRCHSCGGQNGDQVVTKGKYLVLGQD